jgi:segregation and condensation protein B
LKIVTTPMCEKILMMAGISDFVVSKDPDSVNADIAIVLSETKTDVKSIKLRLNTFKQIKNSTIMLSEVFGTKPLDLKIKEINDLVILKGNRNLKVKVYSDFLKDIVEDLGFRVVEKDPDFLVFPDYMKNDISAEIKGKKVIEIPSHKNVSEDPLKRAELRYKLLERELCTRL